MPTIAVIFTSTVKHAAKARKHWVKRMLALVEKVNVLPRYKPPHVSAGGDAFGHPTPSDLDPPRLVPSTPASWLRVSTRTPPFVFYVTFERVPAGRPKKFF